MSLLKKYKLALIIVCLLLVGGFVLTSYVYQNEEPMSEKSISFKGNISGFIKGSLNESSVVVLKARVTSVRLGGVQLERVVSIQYNENENLNFKNINVGDVIVIKGGYLGYDDLLEEYKLINCIILKDE
jgi:hypothetical protein|tara:strand:+ start:438 stop:824 length:387 start_codon:yes stop_codon:yes gene_type:complete